MVKKKYYRESGYAKNTLLRFSLFRSSVMVAVPCYRKSDTGKNRAFHVVER